MRHASSIHEGLARSNSALIDTIITTEKWDCGGLVVKLSDCDADHFRIFHSFVYHPHIYSRQANDISDETPGGDKEWSRLAKTYVLDAHLQAPHFMDAVTDAIIEKALDYSPLSNDTAQTSMHEITYPHTSPKAGIQHLLVDIAATRWNLRTFHTHKPSPSSAEFFFELSAALYKLKTGSLAKVPLARVEETGITCAYHGNKTTNLFSPTVHVCYKDKFKA
ncbi:hypothetical protein LTR86_009573 [Recurvomyces mirabilis]|nr:hypothetical protein LTR86_009573 [Recurvomyces mirabilis]